MAPATTPTVPAGVVGLLKPPLPTLNPWPLPPAELLYPSFGGGMSSMIEVKPAARFAAAVEPVPDPIL